MARLNGEITVHQQLWAIKDNHMKSIIIFIVFLGLLFSEEAAPLQKEYRSKQVREIIEKASIELVSQDVVLERHAVEVACDLRDMHFFYAGLCGDILKYRAKAILLDNLSAFSAKEADCQLLLLLQKMYREALLKEKSGREEASAGGEETVIELGFYSNLASRLTLRVGRTVDKDELFVSERILDLQRMIRATVAKE